MDSNEIEKLIEKAREAMIHSYCPYSNFPVGSALLCCDGSIFTGCNVENSAFASICAERTAFVKAISSGKRSFKAIVVTSNLPYFCAPCGNCRQFMVEFGSSLIVILANNQNNKYKIYTLNDLLPHSFGPKTLLDYNKLIQKEKDKKQP